MEKKNARKWYIGIHCAITSKTQIICLDNENRMQKRDFWIHIEKKSARK